MLCCITLISCIMLVCYAAYVRGILCDMPIRADVHICVDMRQKEVNVCLAEVHPFTIEIVYTNILCAKIPLSPKGLKSESFKIFSVDRFFIVDKIYIYTGIMIFFIFPHIKIWLPKKGFVYLHRKLK